MLALLAMDDKTKAIPAQMSTNAAVCGVTLETTPCQAALSLAFVKSTVNLDGVTATQFKSSAVMKAFVSGVAKTVGLDPSSVGITSFTDVTTRRASELRVESVVTAVGDNANDGGAMSTKLQDKSALQANIVSASSGTVLASATVSSSEGVASAKIAGTTTPTVSSTSSASRAAIGAHAVMMVVVAYFGFA